MTKNPDAFPGFLSELMRILLFKLYAGKMVLVKPKSSGIASRAGTEVIK